MRLDRKKFKAWLEAKPADHIVGHSHDCHICPLALFHQETSGGWEVVISSARNGYGYVIDRGNGDRALPAWADAFAFLADNGRRGTQLTADQALKILGQIDP